MRARLADGACRFPGLVHMGHFLGLSPGDFRKFDVLEGRARADWGNAQGPPESAFQPYGSTQCAKLCKALGNAWRRHVASALIAAIFFSGAAATKGEGFFPFDGRQIPHHLCNDECSLKMKEVQQKKRAPRGAI
ncbi:unnamed protein product [Polarella glacialis]|uniref:Uncharacterized protein n=1 Tax=Polarella glacialis TaxID=89957 RepID=A0A813I5Q6_POLGL|nr:unnamed protein product [Polarella glacialis]